MFRVKGAHKPEGTCATAQPAVPMVLPSAKMELLFVTFNYCADAFILRTRCYTHLIHMSYNIAFVFLILLRLVQDH